MSMLANKLVSSNIKAIKEGKHPFFPPDTKVRWDITFDKPSIYHNYRDNIIKIIRLAKGRNIKLLISTVAYNRMVPPFKAKDNSYGFCKKFYDCGYFQKAKTCLENTLDSDLEPHRASETSNAIIREIADNYLIPLVDVDAAIVNASENRIPGFDLFNDHCHLNNKGNAMLIDVFYEKIRKLLNKY